MVFSICKEVLPYHANLPAIPDSSEVMTKEELACWFGWRNCNRKHEGEEG